ncbi:dihydroxyacetone kinase subunit L, partial [Brucella ceti]
AEKIDGVDNIDAAAFSHMLHAGLEGIQSIGSAKVGDKTLLDTLVPAVEAFDEANAAGKSFAEALEALVAAAEKGRDSTINLVARIGRASRLGERSLGVLDAGATSCAIILKVLGEGARERLQ